jgi:hypothetical protein
LTLGTAILRQHIDFTFERETVGAEREWEEYVCNFSGRQEKIACFISGACS